MAWWEKNNLRLFQMNLRKQDLYMDVDQAVDNVERMQANVLLINVGGLFSFYPSQFDFQNVIDPKVPLLEKIISLCHQKGIKVIGRFDFSKVWKNIIKGHPQWAYRTRNGEMIDYHGFVHTCPNGEYQRIKSIEILNEALSNFPLDGVFFNMIGFQTMDYNHVDHGICHCENCQRLFYEQYHCQLPLEEPAQDPVWKKYEQFKEHCSREVLERIYRSVKKFSQDIAVATYASSYVDIIMSESATEVPQSPSFWEYQTSDNVSSSLNAWGGEKIVADICINATAIDYRFIGVSPSLTEIRMAQSLANGGCLSFCIIGNVDSYPDVKNFPIVKKYYSFHKQHEEYIGNFDVIADVILLKPHNPTKLQIDEYRGFYRILKESHICFKSIDETVCSEFCIKNYPLVICPGLYPSRKLFHVFETYPGKILWTGCFQDPSFLSLFSLRSASTTHKARGAYIHNPDAMKLTKWSFLYGDYCWYQTNDGVGDLELISDGFFGPPELCGGNLPTGNMLRYCSAHGMTYSFYPGELYQKYGYIEHKQLVLDGVRSVVTQPLLETNAPENVEIVCGRYFCGSHKFILSFINLSGFNGRSFHEPEEIENVRVSITIKEKPSRLFSLQNKKVLNFSFCNNKLTFKISKLGSYESIIIE